MWRSCHQPPSENQQVIETEALPSWLHLFALTGIFSACQKHRRGLDTVERHWDEQELAEHWSLTNDELESIRGGADHNQIGFAAMLKFFQVAGRFPDDGSEIPRLALEHLAKQLDVSPEAFAEFKLSGRSWERDRAQIRSLVGFRPATRHDAEQLANWLQAEVLPGEHRQDHVRDAALAWCRRNRIEPPAPTRLDRIVASAVNAFQTGFFGASLEKIPIPCRGVMDQLLEAPDDDNHASDLDRTALAELRADPGRPSLVGRQQPSRSKCHCLFHCYSNPAYTDARPCAALPQG
jgi:hypothetical protein